MPFPDASNDFEYTGVTSANPIVANPTWAPWVFTGTAGIAHQSSNWVTPQPHTLVTNHPMIDVVNDQAPVPQPAR
jgi:hypothetical protein